MNVNLRIQYVRMFVRVCQELMLQDPVLGNEKIIEM